jgi:RNA polymerase sigma-70 factor (ECF subfamily)
VTFEQIYNENVKLVYNLCLQYVHNLEDAEEITQDVFISVHDSLNKFEFQSKISTWIYRIAINKSLDFIKAKNTKKRFAFIYRLFNENNEIQYEQSHFEHPGILMENKEEIKQIFTLIDQLPPNQRTALILNKIEKKSHSEIAEIMLLSSKAVESLIQRGKSNLQSKLKTARVDPNNIV